MKRLLFIPILLLLCGIAESAPSISDYSDGVITCTDAGTKSTAAPLKFETFDDGTVWQNLTESGYWSQVAGNVSAKDNPSYSNENLRTGTGLNARVGLNVSGSTNLDQFYKNNVGFADTGKAYVDFWVRFDFGNAVGSGGGGSNDYQVKLWRMINAYNYTYPAISNFNWAEEGPTNEYYYYQLTREGSPATSAGTTKTDYFTSTAPYAEEVWTHVQAQVDMGTLFNEDGGYTIYNDCVTALDIQGINVLTESGNKLNAVMFGEYIGLYSSLPTPPIEYFDDIYMDNSWARVEIGDNADYDSCTHREIQIPSAWSDTEITITENTGAFSQGETAYLFVIDEDGLVSDGYQITVGVAPTVSPGINGTVTIKGSVTITP